VFQRCVVRRDPNVLEEYIASIFKIDELVEQGSSLLGVYLLLVSCLAYSLTLKIEATCSYEMSVDFGQHTRHYIPEDRTLHSHRCDCPRSNSYVYDNILSSVNLISYYGNVEFSSSFCERIKYYPSKRINSSGWNVRYLDSLSVDSDCCRLWENWVNRCEL
jgi:hypothetical protein